MIQAQLVSQSYRQLQESHRQLQEKVCSSRDVPEAQVEGLLVEKQDTNQSSVVQSPVSASTTPTRKHAQSQKKPTRVVSPSEGSPSDVDLLLSPRARAFRAAGHTFGRANTVMKQMNTEHPQVIISYQSTNLEFMKRLRQYLNDNGVETVDGQLPLFAVAC